MNVALADLKQSDLQALLALHLEEAAQQKCATAFSAQRLAEPDMLVFEARDADGNLLGCAGLKRLSDTHGEIKSVRTHPDHLRKGVSRRLMEHLTTYARKAGLTKLSLETHPTPAYAAARALYERLGYAYCGPFGDYDPSDGSVFMSCEI